ncbi:sigma-70 family RNA polymerase sigma factor [Candidatus Kaiserbacteria bacterium]|nr:sigma-70 family RNA polymerase sigma factor [Candidatus Kaiserbacteria bacterium]
MEQPSNSAEAEKGFMSAYDEHADSIFRFLASKISDREIARDLMQETFTRAWDYCQEGGLIREWKPFLFRTAYNLVVDTYRKKKAVSLDAMIEDQGFAIPDRSDVINIDKAEVKRIRAAMQGLDEVYRDVLSLRFTEDLPPKEIAGILGLSENVVSVRIHRGLAKLREHMNGRKQI